MWFFRRTLLHELLYILLLPRSSPGYDRSTLLMTGLSIESTAFEKINNSGD